MQRVLITGGSKGIGLATARLFASGNHEVILISRDFSDFPQELKNKTKQITFDLQNVNKIRQLASEIGDIDILINNAGVLHPYKYNNYPEEKIEEVLKINLKAPVELIDLFGNKISARIFVYANTLCPAYR